MRKIEFSKEKTTEIATLYTTGESLRKLALKYSVERNVIKRILLESNIVKRKTKSIYGI